jgi:hypothetical protein
VLPVLFPIIFVNLGQIFRFDDNQVFGVPLLGSFGKIATSCHHSLFINGHDLVVSNGVGIVDKGRYPGICQKRG